MEFKNVIQLWKNKGQILEGIKNSVFKRDDVEAVAAERLAVCAGCESYDTSGDGCYVPGTQPCCNHLNGGCGCSLGFAARSMSKTCPKNKWKAVMTKEEEDLLKEKLHY